MSYVTTSDLADGLIGTVIIACQIVDAYNNLADIFKKKISLSEYARRTMIEMKDCNDVIHAMTRVNMSI